MISILESPSAIQPIILKILCTFSVMEQTAWCDEDSECISGTYSRGLPVGEDLRVDSVELQDEFVHQLCVQPLLSSEEGSVL